MLITRPRKQAAGLARALRRRGAAARLAPAIRIGPPASWRAFDAALRRLHEYRAAVFTSANGVEWFFKRARLVLRRPPTLRGRVFAIGPATAAELRRRGRSGVSIPSRFEGEALARHLIARLGGVRGSRILLARAAVARDALPRMLRRAGARVDDVPAYRTLPDPAGRRALRAAVAKDEPCVVTFTSPSTVHQFVGAVGRARARRFFRASIAASIGPITSRALRAYGIRPAVEADPYTSAGLARAIARLDGGIR